MVEISEWEPVAEYYDLMFDGRAVDIPFWTKLASRFGSPILEFGCGTGRLTVPMARVGARLVGIDLSPSMLVKARQKLRKESSAVRKRLSFMETDARSFSLGMKFRAVFSPWGFVPVTKREHQSLLQSVYSHLLPAGYFVIDVQNFSHLEGDLERYYIQDYKKFPQKHFSIVRHAYATANAKTNIGTFIFFWDKILRDGTIKRIITERTEYRYTKEELEQSLESHGFSVREVYGNYDFSRWRPQSERTIIVAQKKTSVHLRRHFIHFLRRLFP